MNLFADVVLRLALKFPRFESIAISYFMKSGRLSENHNSQNVS